MAALTRLRYVETNLTLTCPSPKSFVCNLSDSGRYVTSVFQGLSLSLSLRGAGRREPWEIYVTPVVTPAPSEILSCVCQAQHLF